MKKFRQIITAVVCAAIMCSCSQGGSASEGYAPGDTKTDTSPAAADAAVTGEKTLLDEINGHIALFEYNKAVKLMEDNAEECSSPEFDGVRAELKKHFTELAKQYYQAAATYTVKMEIQGYDYSTGFEGYDPYTATLDPQTVAGEVLTQTEANAANRVTIHCIDDGSFRVTVEFCGMEAVYPADDIVLD